MTDEATPTASSAEVPTPAAPLAPDASPAELLAAEPKTVELAGGDEPPAARVPPTAPVRPAALVPRVPSARPNYLFLAVVSIVSLGLDLGSKAWAKARLDDARSFTDRSIEVVKDHLTFKFAMNRGGAFGLLQNEPESIRRPFFLGISVLAIVFIVSLYRKLLPRQWALKWGLPLVLGGALGNLINRIQYNYVIDFIDFHAGWMRQLNGLVFSRPTDSWPTFNVADCTIVAGVLLMAVDMFTPAPRVVAAPVASTQPPSPAEPPPPGGSAPPESAPAK
jgi:signal peptidase II